MPNPDFIIFHAVCEWAWNEWTFLNVDRIMRLSEISGARARRRTDQMPPKMPVGAPEVKSWIMIGSPPKLIMIGVPDDLHVIARKLGCVDAQS